jgi:threonine synthase
MRSIRSAIPDGAAAQVTVEEIVDGIKLLAETEGIFPKPPVA